MPPICESVASPCRRDFAGAIESQFLPWGDDPGLFGRAPGHHEDPLKWEGRRVCVRGGVTREAEVCVCLCVCVPVRVQALACVCARACVLMCVCVHVRAHVC